VLAVKRVLGLAMNSQNKKRRDRTISEQGCMAFLLGWLVAIIAFGFLINSWLD
jgi:hypothetical protein